MYTLGKTTIRYQYKGQTFEVLIPEGELLGEQNGHRWEWTISEALSGFRWQLRYEGAEGIQLSALNITAKTDYTRASGIYCNGFQSWSESRIFRKQERIQGLRKLAFSIMKPFGDYTYYNYPGVKGVLHSWNYTYSLQPGKRVLFIGSMDEHQAFSNFVHFTLESYLEIRRDVAGWQPISGSLLADFFTTENSERGAFQHYQLLFQRAESAAKPAIGWTSWYHYYTSITEKIILQNLEAFRKEALPIDIFQIDDGYQQRVGDWLKVNKKFPRGMKPIADAIKSNGFKPGIWLAPLAAEQKSDIVKQHPDWIQKDDKGQMLKIGYNPLWSGNFYALDIYHPEVRAYIKEVFRVVLDEWGFELVKLDFLYGACLQARNGKSRAGVMFDAMSLLREAVGKKQILSCGIPMGTAAAFSDYCRIGADVHLSWDFALLRWCGNRERVSTILAIQNTIHRRQLNGQAFINDPDVFMLRKKKQQLNQYEQYSLLLANLLFGDLLFTSDNISDYNADTMHLFKSIFPLLKKKDIIVDQSSDGMYKIHFNIGDRKYMALMNLSHQDKLFKLPAGLYFEPVDQEIIGSEQTIRIPKHGSILLHLIGGGLFAIAGSKGHFFPGSEIERITTVGNKIKIALRKGLQVDPIIYLKVPEDYEAGRMNDQEVRFIKKKGFKIMYAQLSRHETTWSDSD
jgi:alpha-galactosidase